MSLANSNYNSILVRGLDPLGPYIDITEKVFDCEMMANNPRTTQIIFHLEQMIWNSEQEVFGFIRGYNYGRLDSQDSERKAQ